MRAGSIEGARPRTAPGLTTEDGPCMRHRIDLPMHQNARPEEDVTINGDRETGAAPEVAAADDTREADRLKSATVRRLETRPNRRETILGLYTSATRRSRNARQPIT